MQATQVWLSWGLKFPQGSVCPKRLSTIFLCCSTVWDNLWFKFSTSSWCSANRRSFPVCACCQGTNFIAVTCPQWHECSKIARFSKSVGNQRRGTVVISFACEYGEDMGYIIDFDHWILWMHFAPVNIVEAVSSNSVFIAFSQIVSLIHRWCMPSFRMSAGEHLFSKAVQSWSALLSKRTPSKSSYTHRVNITSTCIRQCTRYQIQLALQNKTKLTKTSQLAANILPFQHAQVTQWFQSWSDVLVHIAEPQDLHYSQAASTNPRTHKYWPCLELRAGVLCRCNRLSSSAATNYMSWWTQLKKYSWTPAMGRNKEPCAMSDLSTQIIYLQTCYRAGRLWSDQSLIRRSLKTSTLHTSC